MSSLQAHRRRRLLAGPVGVALLALTPVLLQHSGERAAADGSHATPHAAATAVPPALRPVSLDDAGWRFTTARPGAYTAALARGDAPRGIAWRSIAIPHVSDTRMTDAAYEGGIGWYKLRLRRPRALGHGRVWTMRFEQARRVADVWVDGRRVARNDYPYRPFEVALPQLADGAAHTVIVRTDNRLQTGIRPDGWWNWGGITRAVTLVPQDALVLRDPGFLPRRHCPAGETTGCRWSVLVDATVVNRSDRTIVPRLSARVGAPDAAAAIAGAGARLARPLAPRETARVRFEVPVRDPQLWSPDHPTLYPTLLEVRAAGSERVIAATSARVGLRTVKVEDGLLLLNDEAVELRGASIHEDVPGRGPALSDRDIDTIVRNLRQVGANVTRAHYALDPRLLDRLDEAGILVWAQAPVYHRDRELATPHGRAHALATQRSAVLQTRNHPSVITHSVANELSTHADDLPGTRAFLAGARRQTRDLDPTLPVSVDMLSYPGLARQRSYAQFDLLGLNAYFGWYHGRGGSTAKLSSMAPFVRETKRSYPNAALVVTEFGAEASIDGPAAEKQTYDFQARYIGEVLGQVDRLPQLSGAIYWTLQEFAVKPEWNGGAQAIPALRTAIHHKGVISYDWHRKPGWETLRQGIAATPLRRDAGDVALATGIRQPSAGPGRVGVAMAIAIVAGVVVLLLVDLWALVDWRRHSHGQEDALLAVATPHDADEPTATPEPAQRRRPSRPRATLEPADQRS